MTDSVTIFNYSMLNLPLNFPANKRKRKCCAKETCHLPIIVSHCVRLTTKKYWVIKLIIFSTLLITF